MSDQFTMDKRGIKELLKFYKNAPRAFQRVSAGTLNSMAFADRVGVQKQLKKTMQIRTPSFLKKGTRVQIAKKSDSVADQFSISGSIKSDRHDAWTSIQGGITTRFTQFNDSGRQGGSSRGKAKKESKSLQSQTAIEDFKLKGTEDTRIIQYFRSILRTKARRRKSFYLPKKWKGLKRGVYKFTGGRIKKGTVVGAKLVRLSTPAANIRPKKIDWKQKATLSAINQNRLKAWWTTNMNHELSKITPR